MEYHVFLSYSRKDLDIMRRVRDHLRAEGLEVWTDENLTPGTASWRNAIQDAIRGAGSLVVILSPDAEKSEWVEREMAYARTCGVLIFPLLARGDESDAIPLELINAQWVDIRTDYVRGMQTLVNSVCTHLAVEPLSEQRRCEAEEKARRELEGEIEECIAAGDWGAARESLARLAEEAPDYPKLGTLTAQIEIGEYRARADALFREAQSHLEATRSVQAIRALEEALELVPGYPHAEELLAEAKAQRDEKARQRRISQLRNQVEEHIAAQNWQEARKALARLSRAAPNHPDLAALKARVDAGARPKLQPIGQEPSQRAAKVPVRRGKLWLFSTLMWLPIFTPALGAALGALPTEGLGPIALWAFVGFVLLAWLAGGLFSVPALDNSGQVGCVVGGLAVAIVSYMLAQGVLAAIPGPFVVAVAVAAAVAVIAGMLFADRDLVPGSLGAATKIPREEAQQTIGSSLACGVLPALVFVMAFVIAGRAMGDPEIATGGVQVVGVVAGFVGFALVVLAGRISLWASSSRTGAVIMSVLFAIALIVSHAALIWICLFDGWRVL